MGGTFSFPLGMLTLGIQTEEGVQQPHREVTGQVVPANSWHQLPVRMRLQMALAPVRSLPVSWPPQLILCNPNCSRETLLRL